MSLVMVIDDMAIVREPIAASLREQGYRTVCAAEGREALATVRAETPDLILLDLSMPGMDGMDVLRAFRRENATARTPVILLTASADKQHVVEAARLGVRDYLLKSKFSFPELLVRVRKYLNPLKPREDVISSATRSLSANVAAADAGATASVATCAKVSSTMTQIPRLLTREQCIERATEALAGRALSGVIAQVINLAASPRGDLSQLAGMIGRDPMLSGRVLQAANNTCYASARGPVSTLPEAVRNIGCSAVRSIASTFGVFDAMPPSEADGFNPIRSWQHSLAVAMLCERFAPEAERARAYLIGLCHDLGEILFHTHFGVEYRQLLQVELTTGNHPRRAS
jgi:CheY-like chemotaxis protein